MTRTKRSTMYTIISSHGCDLLPTAVGHPAICVQDRYRQGWPQDDDTIRACRNELERAGISTDGWLS